MPKFSTLGHDEIYDTNGDNPPPGSYDVKLLPDGNEIGRAIPQNIMFTKGNTPDYIEMHTRQFRGNPGPGTYQHGVGPNQTCIRNDETFEKPTGIAVLKPEMVMSSNQSEGYKAPAWAQVPKYGTPGPAAYLTDKWMQEQERNQHLKNFPNLGKAMTLAR